MTALRPYQLAAVESVASAFASGSRSPLLVLPTGSGKTVIAAAITQAEIAVGHRVLFLAPRRELVTQAADKLYRAGLSASVIAAGCSGFDPYALAQVASVDTLLSRLVRRQRLVIPDPGFVILDEAHLGITATRRQLLDLWPGARLLGLTATPTRKDGRALGVLFDRLIEPVTPAALTELGFLVRARYFAPAAPDLARIRTIAGDFHQRDLAARMHRPGLIGDVVEHWLAHAADRRTVVFACSIAHSQALTDEFLRAGVAAEHVDACTPAQIRSQVFARFTSGETRVLCNVTLASYGFDLPELACVVMARPTQSLMLYLQMIGRGLRPADGKSDCLVLDHAGNVERHGFATDAREWTLEGERALVEHERSSRGERTDSAPITCRECSAVYTGAGQCPECGFWPKPKARMVPAIDGTLIEIPAGLPEQVVDERLFYGELRAIAHERNYKPAWGAHKFREKFGRFPPFDWNDGPLLEPTAATRGWVKSRQIAWSRANARR